MQFVRALPWSAALAKLGARTPVGSVLRSFDWRAVPLWLRERAFFSATVESVRWLDRAQSELGDFLEGATDTNERGETYLKAGGRAQFIERMQTMAIREGLGPLDPEDAGTLKDVRSETRLALVFDVQTKSAADFGYWKEGMDPDVLDAFPAQRFIRVREVVKPRPWHQAALGEVKLKTDLAYWTGLNKDFGVPWGPWGFNSGCDVEDVERTEAETLGLIRPDEIPQPVQREFNEGLEASTQGLTPRGKRALETIFGDQVEFSDDRVRWRGARAT